jgi:hypothetical protein
MIIKMARKEASIRPRTPMLRMYPPLYQVKVKIAARYRVKIGKSKDFREVVGARLPLAAGRLFNPGRNGIYCRKDFMLTEEEPCPRKNSGFGRNARRALVATSPFWGRKN